MPSYGPGGIAWARTISGTHCCASLQQPKRIGQSPYDYYYFNNDLNPHCSYWDNYTVNDDTRSVKFKITEVTFADKTTWKP